MTEKIDEMLNLAETVEIAILDQEMAEEKVSELQTFNV